MFSSTINPADKLTVRNTHQSIVSPSNGTSSPGQSVTPVVIGTILGLNFTTTAKDMYVEFKIPTYYANGLTQLGSTKPAASFHIHWTKSANAAETDDTVTWQIDYTVFPGNNGLISSGSNTVSTTDTYLDSSSDSTRYVYRTEDMDVSDDFVAGYYCGLKVSYTATTMSSSTPVLISCDLIMAQYCNDTA